MTFARITNWLIAGNSIWIDPTAGNDVIWEILLIRRWYDQV